MGQRMYPRSSLTRADALARHDFHGPRNDQERRASLSYGMGANNATIVASGFAVEEAAVVAGSCSLVLNLSGNDRFAADVLSDATKLAALIAGFNGGTNVFSLAGSMLSLNSDRTRLTCAPAAVAGYSIAEDTSYAWSLPLSAFDNSAAAINVTSVFVVTNGA